MDIETKMDLVKKSPTEEILVEEEMKQLLETNEHPEHYIGFEISGFLHLGTLLVSGNKVNDLIKAGVDCKIYLADWHSFINNKLGGDWENILKASKYYEKAFNFFCPKAKVILGSNLYHNNDDYWKDVVRFSKKISLSRNSRCLTIMGRCAGDVLDFGQYIYPPMQAVDIKYLGKDIPHGGMDQRKIHVLAREVFPKMGWKKPIPLHHHLLMGLAEPVKPKSGNKIDQVEASKMSKSKPWTAIFIHDTEEEIEQKMKKAWCPEKTADMNPVLELVKYIILSKNKEFKIERKKEHGGDLVFTNYDELEKEYSSGKIHPQDLKMSVAREINKIIEPIREYFNTTANKKLLDVYKEAKITR
jgi:tyrosyl-tRNA synthetase